MNIFPIMVAGIVDGQEAETGLFHFWTSLSSGTKDALFIFGAVLLLALLLFCWALFIRLPKRQSKAFGGGHRSERGFLMTEEERERRRSRRGWFGSRRHRRHRTKRRRNPTLAETGGLPPIRDENDPGNTGP